MKTLKILKKMYCIARIPALTYVVIAVSGCTPEGPAATHTPTVYMAGSTSDNAFDEKIPCYWRNEIRTDLSVLDAAKDGEANAIEVVGNTVYVAGYTENSNSTLVPCCWINGTRKDLPVLDENESGEATAIYTLGNIVLIAGYTRDDSGRHPCYWEMDINKDETIRQDLELTVSGEAYAIKLKNDNYFAMYIAGYTENSEGIRVPCYWENGERTDLPVLDAAKNAEAYSIQVVESKVYTAGYTQNSMGDEIPCYWINGTRIDNIVSDPYRTGVAFAIAVTGSSVFTAGYLLSNDIFSYTGAYWINETHIELPGRQPSNPGYATGLQILENTVYISGFTSDFAGTIAPCYWIDGNTRIDLPISEPDRFGVSNAIYVVEE